MTDRVAEAISRSVVKEPDANGWGAASSVLFFATIADTLPAWGTQPKQRDRMLREFWHTEPVLAGAVYTTASRYAAFGWTLKGPERTVRQVQRMLNGVERGEGWAPMIMKFLTDIFTQDNGAFLEIIRAEDSPVSPVLSLRHLDSGRCERTGNRDVPVLYYDSDNNAHKMKWYQVIALSEFPSPIESAKGAQYCAVTRMLRAAQILKDIGIYKREKISGRFNRAIHFVSGVQPKTISDAMARQTQEVDSQGLTRYIQPLVVGSIDPTANVSVATIEMASLPDGFDEESTMRWYINQMALAFGTDYQDFAPLPGGNLGTAQQSQTLHMKSRGKGPKLFMSLMETLFNFRGIMPDTVHFSFGEQDIAEDEGMANLRLLRANERAARIQSGEITVEIAQQMAVDVGDLDRRYMVAMGTDDLTPDITLTGADSLGRHHTADQHTSSGG
jgi:hypothetical protein